MTTDSKAISIQSYKPAKGTKITVALKDGAEISGTVVSQNADSIKLDDEKVLRRKMRSISFRGRVLAERRARGGTAKSKKKKLSARTESGRPSKKTRGRRRKGARDDVAGEESRVISFSLGDDRIVFSTSGGSYSESVSIKIDAVLRDKLEAFGVPVADI